MWIEFVLMWPEFVLMWTEFVLMCTEFVLLCTEFVLLCTEFVLLCAEFVLMHITLDLFMYNIILSWLFRYNQLSLNLFVSRDFYVCVYIPRSTTPYCLFVSFIIHRLLSPVWGRVAGAF